MIAIDQERCYLGSMSRHVTMIFLAFAVLFGSIHALPWSHGHTNEHQHSHDASHGEHEVANAELGLAGEQPAKKADVSGDVGHQHSMPTGVESFGNNFVATDIKRQSVSLISQVTIPASHLRAPPTQPPSA